MAIGALVGCNFVHAHDATFVGKIGKSEIVACLDDDRGGGSYYYARIGKTLELAPSERAPKTLLENEVGNGSTLDEDSSPRWRIRREPDGTFKGDWMSGEDSKRKTLPIVLHRAGEGCKEFARRREDLPLLPLAGQSKRHPMIDRFRHPLADVTGLRVRLRRNPEAEQAINKQLDSLFKERVLRSFECRDNSVSIDAKKVVSNLLIVEVVGQEYCGGAHPNDEHSTHPFDLNTGELVTWTLSDTSTPLRQGVGKVGKIEKNLRRLLDKELDNAYGNDRENREDCKSFSWIVQGVPDERGVVLKVWADARSSLECRDDFVIPYNKIRPYILETELPGFDSWASRMKGAIPYEFNTK